MNKNDVVSAIAKEAGLSKTKAADALDAFVTVVTNALKKKSDVRLVGFGTFAVTRRKATTGRNPRTGEPIKIAASNQPKFKAGKSLKDAIN